MVPAARRTLAPLLAVLILALLTQPAAAGPGADDHRQQLRTAATVNGAVPSGAHFWEFCPNGNCTRGLVSGDVYGVEVYHDSTFETLYYYGRGKANIEWGAKRLLAYYVRL